MKQRLVLSLLALCVAVPVLFAQKVADTEKRQEFAFNDSWSYLEDDAPDVSGALASVMQWQSVRLPHTWNVTDVVDQVPGYRRSAGWYRRVLSVPALTHGQRVLLRFEGANITSDVFVNGTRVGGHVGGYVGFTVDLTPSLKSGGENAIMVRVSNAVDLDVIPSQKSDFAIMGGLVRNVWLDVVPSCSITALRIATPSVSKSSASTVATVEVENTGEKAVSGVLEAVLKSRKGAEVLRARVNANCAKGLTSVSIALDKVKNPVLWSTSDPALYTLEVSLLANGKLVDRKAEKFGYRWFEFRDHGPFFLNGERLLLRGTHRHEDYAGYGIAMPDSLHRKDMRMIKELGANFVRLAHYPQAPEVYRACDELGILVWDELPWCRGGVGGETWKANARRLLREQILQNFNHPSIIIHSLGNEMPWVPDVPGGDETDSIRSVLRSLNTIAHELDPYRVTSTRKYTEGADLVDIVSPSMWPGWYGGYYGGYEKAIEDAQRNLVRWFHAEYGGDSHVGRHTENPIGPDGVPGSEGWEENIKMQKVKNVALLSDWSESYIVNLFDWYLHISEKKEWLTGSAQWAFKDFPTPLRPENPIPSVNQKGLVDRAGKPKDAYYVFKSYWTTSPEFCYIESHTWTERRGPEGQTRLVKVFSNCPEVELSLNGRSLGAHERNIDNFPAAGLSWQVLFEEGKNLLVAKGRKGGKEVCIDSMTVQYSHKRNAEPDRIELTTTKLDGGRILITATVVDAKGMRCLDYNKRIYFAHDGGGKLLENEGTPTRSSVIELANGRASIEFIPEPGHPGTVEARNQDFKGTYYFSK